VVFKQFTARGVVSSWDVIQAYTRATAAQFLDTLLLRMPFPIRVPQVDGESEFAAEFEAACPWRGLRLFVLPPRSPKLNGAVERANRNHAEEFYQVTVCSLEMKKLNRELRQWEKMQHRASAPVAWLPKPAAGSCCGAHFKARNERCHASTGTSACR